MFQDKYSGLISVANFLGLIKGIIAPYFSAIFAIFFESVDTKILLINFILFACKIVFAISGFLLKFTRFLFFTDFDPP